MDNLPKELEENQLSLQVVIDPETKCLTMKTCADESPVNLNNIPPDIIANDPLKQSQVAAVDFDKMSELEKLIYEQRERLLNIKRPRKPIVNRRSAQRTASNAEDSDELTQNQKSKYRMRRLRERETSEERELRRFRHRIITNKVRLLQRLKNFEDEAFLSEVKKRNTDRVKRNRIERRAKETPEERAQRKILINNKSRLAKIRRKAFKTPEELLDEKEKRLAYLEKYWSRYTEEERNDQQKTIREKAKERHLQNNKEWKQVESIVKGAPVGEIAVVSETIDKI
ncbi:hypothetical protein FF38_14121 [Lucilia cuprina]|uniref:Uncharacterized protein n=1 Tax=Lucilia cuprina TaxID=7375 RepID=A0A0L0C7K7_LUCCU|nr:hypothetical protein FF38_14121 [Lucilia cuprina]